MARRYQIDELLWLRSSPLVVKPANLPPVEEWMGPIPDPTTQRKTTGPRDPNNPNETTPRRPSIFETRHVSRNSNSEDIILGPPKTAFASASRIPGKGSIDATERPSRQPDSDDIKNDRLNFRGKFFKDREAGDSNFDRRDGKSDPFTPRRGDRDDWNAGRPRRTFGQDEQDRKPRRNGDFDRWESRDFNRERDQQTPNHERGGKDKDSRFFPRRDGQPGRARHEGSWFRDDGNQDGPDAEEEKTPIRSRDWRRDRHGADRDWTRGAKFEQDPEWLDSNDKEEPRRVHTQEDFERWKERMKAGSSQAPVEEKKETPMESTPAPAQKPEPRPTDGEIFSSSGTPFQSDTAMERFFGLLGDSKSPQEIATSSPLEAPLVSQATPKKENIPGKPFKSSRFAGLFSPPPGSPAKETDSQLGNKSPTVQPSTTDADQEGFQRILQMLGGSKSRNATPHNDAVQANRPPSLPQAESVQSAISSPSREQVKRPEPMLMQESSMRSAGPAMDPQAREREHLLRLMQQVRVTPVTNQAQGSHGQPQSAGAAPGMMNMPDMLPPPPGLASAPKAPNFIDDPAIANMQRAEPDQLRRRPANGPPMGYFEDMPFPQGGQVPITPGGSRAPQGQGIPGMGVQRPPGFDHLPPPGWAGHQLPPQQGGGPGPLAPPPGIPTPTRGVNPNFMSNMMPMHGNVPPLGERQPFPRGAGGNGSAGFPPPPGMMPPPGYMNGPPPSGFPPMPPNAEALMGLGHGGQGPFDGNPGPQGPPHSSRHLLDMFGQVGAGDARGGMVYSTQLGDMMDEVDFELCLDIDQYPLHYAWQCKRLKVANQEKSDLEDDHDLDIAIKRITTHHDHEILLDADETDLETHSSTNTSTAAINEEKMGLDTDMDGEVHANSSSYSIATSPSHSYIARPSHLFHIYEDPDDSHLENHPGLMSGFTTYSSADEEKENILDDDDYEQQEQTQRMGVNSQMWTRHSTNRFSHVVSSGYQGVDGVADTDEADTDVEEFLTEGGEGIREVEMEDVRVSFHSLGAGEASLLPLAFPLPLRIPSPALVQGNRIAGRRRCLGPRPVVHFE
ncbi:hypothetical protein BDV27DRAFT_147661 [Aspergillus caelatus]|uniref:Uncharacterized protein n=1 Tax=Aspergillus caelatus TaxID=61420 RepID=A0A5N6ZWL5_9EURO|nr:uncharacterized protein BDV27DRAFT_147661 [Aspergillus caelatus]KAE8361653.1 hypothetical protein BDV27DRAFT_147661 [Aspergillus caelatus]